MFQQYYILRRRNSLAFNKNENKNVLRTEFRNLSSFLPFILLSDWKRLNCIKACYKNWANIILLSLYMFDRLYDIICWVRVITFATVRTSLAMLSMFQLSLDTYSHKKISFSNNCDISFEENLHEILYLVLIP